MFFAFKDAAEVTNFVSFLIQAADPRKEKITALENLIVSLQNGLGQKDPLRECLRG